MKVTNTKSIPSPQKTPLTNADGRFRKSVHLLNGRIDTNKLKEQLTQHLGTNAEAYWSAFKKFITCKIRRKEFEGIVRRLLDQEYEIEPKRQRIKALIMSLPREERERLKNIGKDEQNEQNRNGTSSSLPERLPKYNEVDDRPIIPAPQTEAAIVPMCREIKGLPDQRDLYDKLINIAKANELKGISEECVSFMNYALESHLKNLIGDCIQKIRPSGSSLGRNGGGGFLGKIARDDNNNNTNTGNNIFGGRVNGI
nr:6810_t:CDS:2 [Entrophospora candida]